MIVLLNFKRLSLTTNLGRNGMYIVLILWINNCEFGRFLRSLSLTFYNLLTIKMLWGSFWPPPSPLWSFQSHIFQREAEAPFLVTFNIIISQIFPKNFIEITQNVQSLQRFFSSILTIFINCMDFFIFLCYKETNEFSI